MWCNGSTDDFGSSSSGSNPDTATREKYCGVEQWSARLSHKQEVVSNGSNPTHRNKKIDQPKATSHYRADQHK